jgi:hypothetical protein
MTQRPMAHLPRYICATVFSVAFGVAPLSAFGQTAENKAAAEALFDEGRGLMSKGDLAGACRKFEESDRLDKAPGTLLNLADCYERSGKVSSAWATYRRAAPLARERGQTEREQFARSRSSELEPRLPRLRVVVPDRTRIDGLAIKRNDTELAPALWGQALPMDPGSVTVSATAPGRRSFTGQVKLMEGKTEELTVPPLPPSEAGPGTPAPSASRPDAGPAAPAPLPTPVGRTQRTVSYIVGGVAGVALVATGVLAFEAKSKNDDSLDFCDPGNRNSCQPKGISLRDDARRYGDWATVTGVATLVLAGGAATLYFTAPKERVGVVGGFDGTGASVMLRGKW